MDVRERVIRRGLYVAAVLACSIGRALAQEADDPLRTTVLDDSAAPIVLQPASEQPIIIKRPKPKTDPYAAMGLGAGGLRLYPSFEIDGVATSNVNQSASAAKADAGVELKPSLRFESGWSRHKWTGSVSADILHYMGNPSLSTATGTAQTDFRLDIRHTTHADFSAGYVLTQPGRDSSALPATAAGPGRDQTINVAAGITHDFGGLEGQLKTTLSRSTFDDVALSGGGTEVNSDRNYYEPSLTLRGVLGQNGDPLKPYMQIDYAPRLHDQTFDRNGQQRNSQGGSVAIGALIDEGPIWSGDIAAVYNFRSYIDAALPNASDVGLRGNLNWRPTRVLTLTATSDVGLSETETINIGATENWSAGLNLDYALRQNVDVLAGLGLTLANTGAGIDATETAKLGFNWTLNPNMVAGVTYTGTWFNSGSGGSNFNDQRIMTSFILRK